MKIIIQCIAPADDVLLIFPALEALKNRDPQIQIHVLTSRQGQAILETHPCVSKTVESTKISDFNFFVLKDMYHKLKKEKYDLAISMKRSWIIEAMMKVLNIRHRIGHDNGIVSRWLLTKAIWHDKHDITLHQEQINMKLLTPLQLEKATRTRRVYIHQARTKQLAEKLKKQFKNRKKTIFIDLSKTTDEKDQNHQLFKKLHKLGEYNFILAMGRSTTLVKVTSLKGVFALNTKDIFQDYVSALYLSDYVIGEELLFMRLAAYLGKKSLIRLAP